MNEENNLETSAGESLAGELQQMTENLSFPSETDAPIEVVSLSDAENIKSAVSRETKAEESVITEIAYEDFLAMYGTEKDWQNQVQKEFAKKFGASLELLKTKSQDVKIFRAGDVRATLYILGQIDAAKWTGLKTTIVET